MNKYRSYKDFEDMENHLTEFIKNKGLCGFQIHIWYKNRSTIQINIVVYNLHYGVEDLWTLTEALNENYPFRYNWKFSVEGARDKRAKFRLYNSMMNPFRPCNMEVRY